MRLPYHATKPGVEEYDPITHKKVPKYFTPMEASEMLIPKPTAQERRLARINGQRNLSLSEKWANSNETIARGEIVRWVDNSPIETHWRLHMEGP